MIKIDGSIGEGGGQILRSALTLSLMTQKPFQIENIRSKRKKPGLLRQHLTAVHAAQKISNAKVKGNEMNSSSLDFYPDTVKSGDFHFKIGTAGSTMLVFQTIVLPLLFAKGESSVVLEGGTHNPQSPSFDYIDQIFIPILKDMGANIVGKLDQHGFYPAGGGKCCFVIQATEKLQGMSYMSRGDIKSILIKVILSNLPIDIAEREIKILKNGLEKFSVTEDIEVLKNALGPGNVIEVLLQSKLGNEMFIDFGTKGKASEKVASDVLLKIQRYLKRDVFVGPYLADQLLIPFALSGDGEFLTSKPSMHTLTNMQIIQNFLDVKFEVREKKIGCYKVMVKGKKYE